MVIYMGGMNSFLNRIEEYFCPKEESTGGLAPHESNNLNDYMLMEEEGKRIDYVNKWNTRNYGVKKSIYDIENSCAGII